MRQKSSDRPETLPHYFKYTFYHAIREPPKNNYSCLHILIISELSSTIKPLFLFLIVCLLVCVIDHDVNEGEPVDEQFYEDQFRDSEPEGQCFDQDLPEGFEDDKFNPIL